MGNSRPIVVTDYRDKKLLDYDYENALVVFWHGLGDLLMFEPIFSNLPGEPTLGVQPGVGQEHLVEGSVVVDKPLDEYTGYDHVFCIAFNMSEGTEQTKQEKCVSDEIGTIRYEDWAAVAHRTAMRSNFVGVHFQGTCLPESTNPDEATAKMIWDEVLDAGYIPIEIMFEHMYHNPVNARYPWISCSTRHAKPTMGNLIESIKTCRAFIGVASGPWVLAQIEIAPNVILLEKHHKACHYTKVPVAKTDIVNYKPGSILKWLK